MTEQTHLNENRYSVTPVAIRISNPAQVQKREICLSIQDFIGI